MATFVLVHGAWHGGWCWQRVRDRLTELGNGRHTVYTPTLSGLAERRHLIRYPIDLTTHVTDIVNLITWEDLHDVVLCGHSFGGLVVTGAADALGDRIGALVYLDAFVPEDGDTGASVGRIPPPEGVLVPSPPAAFFGLSGAAAEWVETRLTPHPAATTTTPLRLRGNCRAARTYALATGWPGLDALRDCYARAAADPTWMTRKIDGSYDLMVDRPDDVADLLLEAAASVSSARQRADRLG